MIGPGKYDSVCTLIRKACEARSVVLIIVEGARGNGLSAQIHPADAPVLATVLRDVADGFEADAVSAGLPCPPKVGGN